MILAANDAYSEYNSSLRAVARGLWTEAIDYMQAYQAMDLAIRAGITKAWYEGLKEAGIQPSEMSPDEEIALRQTIVSEQVRMNSFLTYCEQNTRATGVAWGKIVSKVELWAMRAREARNKALLMAKSDPKLIWALGRTEKHCSTCAKLNGKVKRASYWRKVGVQPQSPPNPYLECQGWRCDCTLSPTEEAMSKGTLGRFP